ADESKIGLGAVLAQMNEKNKEVVIAYGSRSIVGVHFMVHRSEKKIKNADALSRLIFKEEAIKESLKDSDQEINKMDHNKKKKLKYVKSGNKWFDAKRFKGKWDDVKYFNDKKAVLLDLEDKTEKEFLKKLGRKNKSQVIVIDEVDGIGKSTVVKNIIKQLGKEGLKVRFNTFKRRRNDDKRFRKLSKKYEWLFRKQVVEEINSKYFYQKTKSFDRGYISPYGNHKMEKEIFKYKDIIDNTIVIFLENKECWNNYIGRETKKSNEKHKVSYETLNEKEYRDMVKMFKEH
ncbi:hypothetical protein C1645_833913, partial [Glomus cerebriforme]